MNAHHHQDVPVHEQTGEQPGNVRTTFGVNLRSHLEVPEINRSIHPVDPWRWIETDPKADRLGVAETQFAVGNGYLGLRANPEEGRDSETHGTYINGLHETWRIQHAEDAYGLAREGQTMINAPDVKTMRLYIEDEPLRVGIADLLHYERAVDFRDGILRREVEWWTPSGKKVIVRSTRMVSMKEKHLAVMTLEIELPDDEAPVVISSQMLNRQDGEDEYHVGPMDPDKEFDPRKSEGLNHRVLEPDFNIGDGEYQMHGFQCANSRMTVAVAVDHEMSTENDYEIRTNIEDDSAKVVYHVDAQPGRSIKLVKYASYHTSRKVPARELGHRCDRTLMRARNTGAENLQADQRAWFDDFWASADVEVGGDDAAQQAIRWNIFQLAQVSARAETNGIASKGVTGNGYSGHYFWDAETYVLPFLTYTNPRSARNALRFRYSMLDSARERATELAVDGALYPWRTINGKEASAYYEAGTAQYHINADIAHALIKYFRATWDTDFLVREGVDVLIETARMWISLGFFGDDGDFNIHGVTGPDEYTTVVDNNLFTNAMARFNLRAAATVAKEVAEQRPAEWKRICERLKLADAEVVSWAHAARSMVIEFDPYLGIHPQDQHFLEHELWDKDLDDPKRPLLLHFHPLVIYRHQVIKQADVVLAMFLRGDEFTYEEKRANFEYYDPLTTGDSTLSAVVQAIIAAEIGYSREAFEHFEKALVVDLADVHGNAADGVHIASTGGVWSSLVFGFGGMRDYSGTFSFDPRLPRDWTHLDFRVTIHGSRLKIRVTHYELTAVVESGDAVPITVQGQNIQVSPGAPMTVELNEDSRSCLESA